MRHQDHGVIMYSPFPVRCLRGGGTFQAPLRALRPGLAREDVVRTKEITKERTKERTNERDKLRRLPLTCRRREVGCGQEQWGSPPPGAQLPGLRPLRRLPQLRPRELAHYVLPLGRRPRPTSVVARKASTARPRLSFARRSRIFHLSFHLLVSFRTSAHNRHRWSGGLIPTLDGRR